jgi:hypothetical protein
MFGKLCAIVGAIVLLSGPASALTRESRSLYVGDLHFGYSAPFGNYNGIGSFDWSGGYLTASELHDPTYHLGFNLAKIQNDRVWVGVGFRYTRVNVNDNVGDFLQYDDGTPIDTEILKFNQYDMFLDVNYYLMSLYNESFAPYFGGQLIGGLTSWSPPGYRSESKFSLGLAVNFGADFKIWSAADKRSFVTLASVNSWQLLAGGNRPRYLNIGGGIRYFFRP